jgi:branched-chain amino acid transport system permease protein
MKKPSIWGQAIRAGLIGGAVSLLICLVGMVVEFSDRDIIHAAVTMGQVLAIAPVLVLSYSLSRRLAAGPALTPLLGAVSGLASGAVLATLVALGQILDIRSVLVNASPALYALLTFNLGAARGIPVLIAASTAVGALSASFDLVAPRLRSALIQAFVGIVLIGLLRDLIINIAGSWGRLGAFEIGSLVTWLFDQTGLNVGGTVFLLVLIGGLAYWRYIDPLRKRASLTGIQGRQQTPWRRWGTLAAIALLMIFLPRILGLFLSDVLDTVGLFILMGLGLNIVVGFAGLLDLGYVAFFAIGAYTMGVLTSPELAHNPLTYWEALPIALLVAVASGVILGLPVLKMRGDYLAIVTLGFGEIVRLLVLSDWLRPWLGGPEGIQLIAHPIIGPYDFGSQQMLYFVIVVFIGIASFIAIRLKASRLGRSWMALREDEDVAKAMGINHVTTKLMAFASGAFFAGLGGTIFAAKLGSAYPQSFQFLVSINVLSLIIIGGMGSIPGVLVGGLVLVGMPEILREFADFRYLVYGAALVAMMLTRPEGLIPEVRRELELHEEEPEQVMEPEPIPEKPEGRS